MKTVVTIRMPQEYAGMLENIKLELSVRGIEAPDAVLMRAVVLTGIRCINQMITQGINIFEDERNHQTDD